MKIISLAAVAMCFAMPASATPRDMSLCSHLADAWKAAYNAQDAARLAAMYDPADGIYSNPYWSAVGRKDIEEKFHADFALGVKYSSIACDRAERHDKTLLARGTFAGTAKLSDGRTLPVTGHWLVAAKDLGDGKYAMTSHNANIQLPPPH